MTRDKNRSEKSQQNARDPSRMPGDFQSAQAHDPTQYMGQGNDFGTQYRSGCLDMLGRGAEMTMEMTMVKRCWCWNDPRVQESPRWWDESHCLWNGLIFIGHWHVGTFYLEPKPGRGLYYFDEEQKRLFEEIRDAYQATMIWLYLVGACWCTYIWHAYLPTIFLRYDPQVLTGWWFQHVSRCFNHFHAIATPQKDRKGLDTWKLWRKHHLYHPGNLRIAIGLVSIAREIGWRFSMTPGSLRRRCMPRASEERPDGNCPTTGVKGGFSKWWAPQTSNPFQPIHC